MFRIFHESLDLSGGRAGSENRGGKRPSARGDTRPRAASVAASEAAAQTGAYRDIPHPLSRVLPSKAEGGVPSVLPPARCSRKRPHPSTSDAAIVFTRSTKAVTSRRFRRRPSRVCLFATCQLPTRWMKRWIPSPHAGSQKSLLIRLRQLRCGPGETRPKAVVVAAEFTGHVLFRNLTGRTFGYYSIRARPPPSLARPRVRWRRPTPDGGSIHPINQTESCATCPLWHAPSSPGRRQCCSSP